MPISVGVGRSFLPQAEEAGEEATLAALKQIGTPPALLIVFASVVYDQDTLIRSIRKASPGVNVVGCSDSGEITKEGPSTKGVVIMALASDTVKFTIGLGKGVKENSRKAGLLAAEDVKNKITEPLELFIMLPDGVNGNGADIVRGVQDILGKNFPIFGGSAGDDFAFKKTYQYYNDQVLSDTVIGIGISGKFSFGAGVRHGWQPIGLPMKVTDSQGAVLKKLDDKPALKIYEEYFGKKAEELTKEPLAHLAYTYPLGMSAEGSDELLLRDVVLANDKGEITCAAEIPQGKEIRLMLGDVEQAIGAAREAAENVKNQLQGNKPDVIFIFNCIARYKLFGTRTGDEIKAVQNVLGPDVPLIGFYTYGEQAPIGGKIAADCNSCFHNETIVILALKS
jgi:hypothetical protein